MNRFVPGFAVVALIGLIDCHRGPPPTRDGTVILTADLATRFAPDVRTLLRPAPTPNATHAVTCGNDGVVAGVDFGLLESPSGGRYLGDVRVTVQHAAGFQVTANVGDVENRGTVESPLMAVPIWITFVRSGHSGNCTAILRADGTVQ